MLEVTQGNHFSVNWVHGIEGLLEADLDLGPDCRLAGTNCMSQKLGGQRGGAGLRHGGAIERDLTSCIPHHGTEMKPMQFEQLAFDNAPPPQKQGDRRVLKLLRPVLQSFQESLLDDVLVGDAFLQPSIHPEVHHPTQLLLVPCKQRASTPEVRICGRFQKMVCLNRIVNHHGPYHNLIVRLREIH